MDRQIFDRLGSAYPRLLNLLNFLMGVFLMILILVFARDIISVIQKKKELPAVQAYPPAKPVKKTLQDYAPLVRHNLFGGPSGELRPLSVSADGSASRADATGLNLAGTVSGARRHSYAVFADKSGNQEVFRVGDTVHNSGILERVEKDRVFIRKGGMVTELPIADTVSVVETSPSQAAARPAAFARSVGEGAFVVDQRRVQQAIEKPNQIMTDARLLPNIVEGKQQGFVLNEVKPGGIYQSLGLQNGDVLLRINEFSISNPEAALQALSALKGMERVQLDIVRNGSKMTMNYQIR